MHDRKSIKRSICAALEDAHPGSLSMGELMDKADIVKTLCAEVSSSLYKLARSGVIRVEMGPATSRLGRRFVKRYSWVKVVRAIAHDDPRRMFGLK